MHWKTSYENTDWQYSYYNDPPNLVQGPSCSLSATLLHHAGSWERADCLPLLSGDDIAPRNGMSRGMHGVMGREGQAVMLEHLTEDVWESSESGKFRQPITTQGIKLRKREGPQRPGPERAERKEMGIQKVYVTFLMRAWGLLFTRAGEAALSLSWGLGGELNLCLTRELPPGWTDLCC